VPHYQSVSLVGPQQGSEHRDRGGLARSIRSEQAEDLALLDIETDALDRFEITESFVQVLDFDGVHDRISFSVWGLYAG
jgi:hypothetical protein